MSLLNVSELTIKIRKKTVLHKVNLSVERGEIVTIVGPNGSGKSTLLKAIIGVLEPDSGSVGRSSDLRIGYVPQKLHIDPTFPLTVRRFLCLPYHFTKLAIQQSLEQAGVEDLELQQMADLSGGQFQRVLLARALLSKPNLLILDEPTQGLDQAGSANFYRQIEGVRNQLACSVLMVSHELHVVMATSDKVICLNGHVCCEGKPEQVASAPEYLALFGSGTQGALALYRHEHTHSHDHSHHHFHENS